MRVNWLNKSIIYLILNATIASQLLYPWQLFAQDRFTNRPPPLGISEPPLISRLPIILPDLGDASSGDLSTLDEKKIGERIMREIRKDSEYSNNWLLYDYLNRLGKELVNSARQQKISGAEPTGPFSPQFEFFGVVSSSVNAFALPGGYIGMHTGLIVLAGNESELASVLGHEIGHVTQKHIARGAGQGSSSGVLMLASLLVAALAVKSNPGMAQGLAIGGQALAIQNQLFYSREAEREADRVGFQILQASGYDVAGMPGFFQKLQRSTGLMDSGVPAYVRTHPLTVERIADMQDRARFQEVKKLPESQEFYLMQSIAKLEQQGSPSILPNTMQYFEVQAQAKEPLKSMQGYYGLALSAIKEKRGNDAEFYLKKAKDLATQLSASGAPFLKTNVIFEVTQAQIAIVKNNFQQAIDSSNLALKMNPNSKAAGVVLVESLLAAGKVKEATDWLVLKTKYQKDDAIWWNFLAQGYALQNQSSLYHAALAEKYVCEGALPAAIEQLRIAREESTGNFYQLSELDARKRQLESLYREDIRENGRPPQRP